MPRVPVPDDYDGDEVLVAGTEDAHYPYADVQVESDRARTLRVREDEDGKYVGPPEQHVGAVADYFGVDVDTEDETESGNSSEDDASADSEPEPDSVTPESIEDAIEAGECPWCDDYTGDGVPQHASSAHPDEWQAYKEASE
jgi:hypothetical protein